MLCLCVCLFVCFGPTLLFKLTTPGIDDHVFGLLIARAAIAWSVKLQLLMASKVSFVFSFAKDILSIIQ